MIVLGLRDDWLRGDVIRIARQVASGLGLSYTEAFGDSLSADLARLKVVRLVRRARPGVSVRTVTEVVNEVLAPPDDGTGDE